MQEHLNFIFLINYIEQEKKIIFKHTTLGLVDVI